MKAGQVYLISDPGRNGIYKIGFTTNWTNRQREYRRNIPNFKLEYITPLIENAYELERIILNTFENKRLIIEATGRKSEWIKTNKKNILKYLNSNNNKKNLFLHIYEYVYSIFFKKNSKKECQYIFIKGRNKGNTCLKKTINNTKYCNIHSK